MSMSKTIVLRGQPVAQGREPLLCAPLVAGDAAALQLEAARVVARQPDLIEWRVDFFRDIADTAAVLAAAAAVRTAAGTIPIVFTRRSIREGGEVIALGEEAVCALQEAVCASGAIDFVDCELSCDPAHIARTRAAAHAHGAQLILSSHNFESTPPAADIVATLKAAAAVGADIAKVAVMPTSLDDVLTLLAATLQGSRELEIPLITMSMGPWGSITRMFGWMFGSSVSFAVGDSASAPGQVPIDDLRQVLAVLQRAQQA